MGEGIYSIIADLYAGRLGDASVMAEFIEEYMRVVMAAGALIYIFGKLIVQMSNNEDISIIPYLRPFAIVLILPFSGAICDAIDATGNAIRDKVTTENTTVADKIRKQSAAIREKVDEKWDLIGNDPAKYQEVMGSSRQDDSFLGTDVLSDMKLTFARLSEDFKMQLLSAIQDILLAIMYIAECALLLISISFRLILRMGFPITIALAIFPGFTSAVASWFGRYINYALLPAVAALYSSIAFKLCEDYITSYDVAAATADMGIETQQPEFMGLAFIAILILSLVGYLQVPSMTAMLVSVGGVGQMIQGFTRNATAIGGRTAAGFGVGGRRMPSSQPIKRRK